jgi:PAS domain S-box-containing protein
MLWLFLLGAVTALVIVLRRVLRRQQPLDDQVYVSRVAVDHVHSGVAWVKADGTIGSMNPALAATLGIKHGELDGRDWMQLFPERERDRVGEAYRQMLLLGMASMEIHVERSDRSLAWLSMALVALHDRKTRFAGHHCLTVDLTHEKNLEEKVKELTDALERYQTLETR